MADEAELRTLPSAHTCAYTVPGWKRGGEGTSNFIVMALNNPLSLGGGAFAG